MTTTQAGPTPAVTTGTKSDHKMKEKIYTVAIPLFSLLCSCDAKERIELPKHEEGEATGKCLTRSSLFPDDLIAQIELEFCADTEKDADDCRKRTGSDHCPD